MSFWPWCSVPESLLADRPADPTWGRRSCLRFTGLSCPGQKTPTGW